MNLQEWRTKHGFTLNECAALLGLGSARTYQRYETGENRPSALLTERIVRASNGDVSAQDIHAVRLSWERANLAQTNSEPEVTA